MKITKLQLIQNTSFYELHIYQDHAKIPFENRCFSAGSQREKNALAYERALEQGLYLAKEANIKLENLVSS